MGKSKYVPFLGLQIYFQMPGSSSFDSFYHLKCFYVILKPLRMCVYNIYNVFLCPYSMHMRVYVYTNTSVVYIYIHRHIYIIWCMLWSILHPCTRLCWLQQTVTEPPCQTPAMQHYSFMCEELEHLCQEEKALIPVRPEFYQDFVKQTQEVSLLGTHLWVQVFNYGLRVSISQLI